MFCGKCGKELNENGLCSVCNPEPVVEDAPIKPVVEETPIKPMEKFDSSSNSVKPLASASWFAPVAFVGPAIVSGIFIALLTLIVTWVTSEFYYDSTAVMIANAISGALGSLITAALVLVGTVFIYKIAFKSVDSVLKEKSKLIFFLPFVGIWASNILTSIVASPISTIVTALLREAGLYEEIFISLAGLFTTGFGVIIDVAVAVGLYVVTKKILAKIEENN